MAPASRPASDSEHTHTRRRRRAWWTWLLLALPYVALCFPRLYARSTPALFGFPFFYWYQFAWVVLTSLLLYVVYLQFKTPE